MNAPCRAVPEVPRALRIHPDSVSASDHAVQASFARLMFGRKSVPADIAYAAYERSVERENSYATLVGSSTIALAGRDEFIACAWAERPDRDALGVLGSFRLGRASVN